MRLSVHAGFEKEDAITHRRCLKMETSWTPETLRAFEEEIKEIFLTGAIRAPVHLSGGNEEQLIEIFREVKPSDWVFSTHRSHLHALLKGVPPERVKADILAGKSIHLNYKEHNFATSAIVGGCLPIALGVALAIKRRDEICRRGEGRRVWVLVGDMTATTGIFHECVTYAENFNLPLWIVVECNGLSTNTPTDEVWGFKHEHRPKDGVRVTRSWEKGALLEYCYERVFPHINAGRWVEFR